MLASLLYAWHGCCLLLARVLFIFGEGHLYFWVRSSRFGLGCVHFGLRSCTDGLGPVYFWPASQHFTSHRITSSPSSLASITSHHITLHHIHVTAQLFDSSDFSRQAHRPHCLGANRCAQTQTVAQTVVPRAKPLRSPPTCLLDKTTRNAKRLA